MSFEVGYTYNDKQGNTYKCLSVNNNIGIFKYNNVIKKLKIINYCGVDAAIQYGEVLFKSAKVVPQFDAEFDLPPKPKTDLIINKHNEGYINVFKSHKSIS